MAGLHVPPLAASVFTRLSPDIEKVILDTLDFPALMKFRLLSRAALALVESTLRAEFRRILIRKLPQAVYFEATLRRLEGYVGSFCALAFLLRAGFHERFTLEVFLPRSTYDAMCRHMRDVQGASCAMDKPISHLPGVLCWSVWRTRQGRVGLFKSSSNDALLPIVYGTSTAMMVYANPDRFGAVWPSLTFRYRAMPGPLFDGPSLSQKMLRDVGFGLRLYVWMWPDGGASQECAAERYACPAQPRYVQDAGSFRGTWRPGHTEPLTLRLCFRLDPRPCRGRCRRAHVHLTPLEILNEY